MLLLGTSDSLAAGATNAATVNCTVCGAQTDGTSPNPVLQKYDVLYQGQLASSVTAIITDSVSQETLIKTIHLFNTGSAQQVVTLAVNGTASSNTIATITIPANGFATYEDGRGWTVYTAAGIIVTGSIFLGNGLGTPSAATTALTASTEVLQGGTLIALPTNYLIVGQRFRWHIGIEKTTAAGAATWAVKVKWGTNGTTADAAIASWTSGTNTGAIDQCTLDIEAVITALGSGTSATAACIAFYVNTLTNVTGLGRIDPVPTSTAGFDSTAVSPFLHVDITMGASAVCTGVGSAEQVK